MKLVYTEQTPSERDRVYARLESHADDGIRSNVQYGSLSADTLALDPVAAAERDVGEVPLDDVEEYYVQQVQADFEERPLAGFVEECTEQTPHDRLQAAVVVTHGWFDMPVTESVRAINQHVLRDDYQDLTRTEFEDLLRAAQQTRRRIQTALEYPFGL